MNNAFGDLLVFFFSRGKTASKIGVRLLGSERCIRDRGKVALVTGGDSGIGRHPQVIFLSEAFTRPAAGPYTPLTLPTNDSGGVLVGVRAL